MANTIAYEATPTGYAGGATAPTAAQAAQFNELRGVVTGDGATASITFTHNMGISAADLARGLPHVDSEILLAAGYTAAAFIASKTANTVVFTNTAFTGAGLRIRVSRPNSLVE
jgi:hypothetical protein